jgi:hypothetical protein
VRPSWRLARLRRLTVKLRGRPEAPDQAPRAHNLFYARGAITPAVHGPLQRLLDGHSERTAEVSHPDQLPRDGFILSGHNNVSKIHFKQFDIVP